MQAGQFVQVIEEPRLKIGCIEEIAWRQGFIQMRHLLHYNTLKKSGYGEYLGLLKQKV
jgi:glucose-1-phosphate thymidylyltransferase